MPGAPSALLRIGVAVVITGREVHSRAHCSPLMSRGPRAAPLLFAPTSRRTLVEVAGVSPLRKNPRAPGVDHAYLDSGLVAHAGGAWKRPAESQSCRVPGLGRRWLLLGKAHIDPLSRLDVWGGSIPLGQRVNNQKALPVTRVRLKTTNNHGQSGRSLGLVGEPSVQEKNRHIGTPPRPIGISRLTVAPVEQETRTSPSLALSCVKRQVSGGWSAAVVALLA